MLHLSIKHNIIIRRGPAWRRGISGIIRWSPEAQQKRNHVDTLIDTNPSPTTSTLLLLHQSQHHIEGMYMNSTTVMDYILSNAFNSMHIAEAIGTLAMDIDIADYPMDVDNEPVRPTLSTEAMDIDVNDDDFMDIDETSLLPSPESMDVDVTEIDSMNIDEQPSVRPHLVVVPSTLRPPLPPRPIQPPSLQLPPATANHDALHNTNTPSPSLLSSPSSPSPSPPNIVAYETSKKKYR